MIGTMVLLWLLLLLLVGCGGVDKGGATGATLITWLLNRQHTGITGIGGWLLGGRTSGSGHIGGVGGGR